MAANDPAITCGKEVTADELYLASIGKDAQGNPVQRLYKVTDTGNFAECGKTYSKEDIQRRLYTLDSNGRVALRVSITP